MLHKILYNEGAQTVTHIPPVRAATATYSCEDLWEADDSSARVVVSGSATVDSLSTTVDLASGRGEADPKRVNVASTTGVAVGDYLWLAENGQGEVIKVRAFATDDYILCEDDLIGDYTTAATVEGMEMTFTFPASFANDEELVETDHPFRVVFEYDVFGHKRRVQEQIRIVRNSHSDIDTREALEMFRTLYPDIDGLPASGERVLEKWAETGAKILRADLLAKNQEPELFLSGDRGPLALCYKLQEIAGENGMAPGHVDPVEFAENGRRHLVKIWESLTRGTAGKETLDISTADQANDNQSNRHRGINIAL